MKTLRVGLPLGVLLLKLAVANVHAQCTTARLNWDVLDFMTASFDPLNNGTTQRFTIGKQMVTITHNYSSAAFAGENNEHTGDAGSYGTGEDVKFTGNGSITFTFSTAVTNVKLSVYDIDVNQRLTVTAVNGAVPVNVVLTRAAGTYLSISGSGTPTATATAGGSSVASDNNTATANIDIAGPVTGFTLAISLTGIISGGAPAGREDGSFWVSDVEACVPGSFSSNFREAARPLPGMPSYVLTVRNNEVYYTNPATGKSKLLFTDPGHTNLNSVAYDPVNKMVYYAYSLTGNAPNNRTLRRYDYEQDTLGVLISDARNLGIVLYDNGVESGAGSFYDGSWYIGIEANGTGYTNGRESKIWRIDFNALQQPVIAAQVFAIDGQNHDWGDFGVHQNMLYNFDADAGNENLHNVDLNTRAITTLNTPAALPRQVSIDWQGNIFNVGNTAGSPSTGSIARYFPNTGTQNTPVMLMYNGNTPSGSWGDGAEAFRPKVDYGDAPTSYEPVSEYEATHERIPTLRLGNNLSVEWNKALVPDGTNDTDDDAIPGTLAVGSGATSFSFTASVFNNTGANATLVAWLDVNNDGIFQASEGRSFTIASNPSMQTLNLGMTGLNVTALVGSTIYLRLRLTSAANGMTTAHATGFFEDGEVEDYPVVVSGVLPRLTDFNVRKNGSRSALIRWNVTEAAQGTQFVVERSADGLRWHTLGTFSANECSQYAYTDSLAIMPVSYYRLVTHIPGGSFSYSDIKQLSFHSISQLTVSPNPASVMAQVQFYAEKASTATLQLYDMQGKLQLLKYLPVQQGINRYQLNELVNFSKGVYELRIFCGTEQHHTKIIIH